MPRKKNTQLTELAETLKTKNETPEQTVIPTSELEDLKAKTETVSKGRRKGVYSFTLSDEVITEIDTRRGKILFHPSRSEYLEYVIKEYLKNHAE